MPKEYCWWLCRQDGSHEAILLPDGVDVIIGRGPLTKIKDQKLSRNQLKLTANYGEEEVVVEQLGPNPATVDGKALSQNKRQRISDGSHICLLYNKYLYNVRFISDKCDSYADSTASLNEINRRPDSPQRPATTAQTTDSFTRMKSPKRTLEELENSEESDGRKQISTKKTKAEKFKGEKIDNDDDEEEESVVTESHRKLEEMRRVLAKNKEPPSSGMKRSISLPLGAAASSNSLGKLGLPQVPGDQWEEFGKLAVYTCRGAIPREKIAGFDLDWTIIGTKSGKVFPVGNDDWRILYTEVIKKLRQLFEDDYKIVFFSNQKNLTSGSQKFTDFKRKLLNIIAKIGVPVQVFVSTGHGIYRKPAPGMWNHLVDVGNEGLAIDVRSSFYVGDAAGRPANWGPKKKKDFACGDRLFALNIGLKFYTPEEFFLNEKTAHFALPDFDPRTLNSDASLTLPPNATLIPNHQEMVVMVGYPASGKSYFVKDYLIPAGYVHINRDTLGSWQKCISVAQAALKKGKSVVIDNTNPDATSRKKFCECAQAARVPCRCFIMNVSLGHAKHTNKFRLLNNPDEIHQNVNDLILNSFRAKYEEPKLMEGFNDILRISFIPKFEDEKLEKLYRMFLTEK